MRSVKPGRGPSFMGGVGGVAAAIFGVIWTISALRMGAPVLFAGFGAVFTLVAAGGAAYNFVNATSKRRFSAFDITDEGEETDPLNERFGEAERREGQSAVGGGFCPYCGAKADAGYRYCRECGKELSGGEAK